MRALFKINSDSHGRGSVIFSWQPQGNFLATAGSNGLVCIFDRHGKRISEVNPDSTAAVRALEWDTHGDCLAIMGEGSSVISLWDVASRSLQRLEMGFNDPSFMLWSERDVLAIGTAKGNLLLYDRRTRKKVPIMGKNPGKITCGAWLGGDRLALGSEDRIFTLSNVEGDTLEQTDIKFSPQEMSCSPAPANILSEAFAAGGESKENGGSPVWISVVMGERSLLFINPTNPDDSTHVKFQENKGNIVGHAWIGTHLVAVAFSRGHVDIISTNTKDMGDELASRHVFTRGGLAGIHYSPSRKRMALVGDGNVKFVDTDTYEEVTTEMITLNEDSRLLKALWSPDSQILTVSSTSGVVYNFLANLSMLHASYGMRLAYLSSLREITVLKAAKGGTSPPLPITVSLSLEPTLLAVGTSHAAAGVSNRVAYYRATANDTRCVSEEDYRGLIGDVKLNSSHAAVLSDGKVLLHSIEPSQGAEGSRTILPAHSRPGADSTVTCIGLTDNVLAYGSENGSLELFHLQEWLPLEGAGLKHTVPLRRLSPNYLGTKILVLDAKDEAFIFCSALGETVTVPLLPSSPGPIFWDQVERHVFSVGDSSGNLHMYTFVASSVRGSHVTKLGSADVDQSGSVTIRPQATPMPANHTPILSCGGVVTCQVDSMAITTFVASPFDALDQLATSSPDRRMDSLHRKSFLQNLALLRLKHAWRSAVKLDDRSHYLALGNRAMEVMDVNMAIHVYRELGDAGMVMGLEQIAHVEDKNLLAGHIALLFGDYSLAQELFLSSSMPSAALQMRQDLLQWDHALKLAQTLDTHAVPVIYAELGQQLEFKGEWQAAMDAYQSALSEAASQERGESKDDTHPYRVLRKTLSDKKRMKCVHGTARCLLRLGNIHKGITMAKESDSVTLLCEAASILEDIKQHSEAASLWELSGKPERAAAIYIETKNLAALDEIISDVTMPKLLCQYAKICETGGRFQKAADSYERAHDLDSVVRLCLEKLNKPEKAIEIVRRTASSSGAAMLSQHCQEMSDWKGAMEFLLISQQSQKAFELAKSHAQMDAYASALGERMTPPEAIEIAKYYESHNELGLAGKFYSRAGQYHRALKLFLQCGDRHVDDAIRVVGKARNDMLIHTLIDFLMGETDGVSKDPNYIYRLYMALGNYAQAARTATVISNQEQDLGNYKVAHAILHETIKELESHRVRVPRILRNNFVLLHSYMLVKILAGRDDHEGAARLLLRVAKSVSKFPSHTVPILTSTVIECQRAGLKNSAFQYASMLMRQEYRNKVDKNVRRQIEQIVRRPSREEEPEDLSDCPVSGIRIPVTQLECPTTKDDLPMCVVTGRHMDRRDWCNCPVSGMPALYSAYKRHIEWIAAHQPVRDDDGQVMEGWGTDPVMGMPVSPTCLRLCTSEEIDEIIMAYNNKEEEKKEAEAGGGDENQPSNLGDASNSAPKPDKKKSFM